MPKVLYNKYRSSDFDRLTGQEHISKILKNAVKSGKISHAYLFVGSRGTGKTSTARILAKALNCTNLREDGNPCNECPSCLSISQGKFLDLIEIDAASNRGIDQIRELKEKLEFSPVEGKFKIYIIDEVHMLTKEAFNALLKTLEEPPEHVIFMLATTDVHKLPPTILSRCQRYDLRLGSDTEISKVITEVSKSEGVKLDAGAIKLLVSGARGSYRDALSLLDAVISGQINSEKPEEVTEAEVRKSLGIPDTTIVSSLLEYMIEGNGVEYLKIVDEIEDKGVSIPQIIKYSLSMLQDILLKKISNKFDENEYPFASNLSLIEVTTLINLFLNAERNIKTTSVPVLILEMLVVQAGSLKKSETKPTAVVTRSEVQAKAVVEEKVVSTVEIKEEEEEEEEVQLDEVSVTSSAGSITFDQIKEKWGKIVEGVKPTSGHLFAFLGSAKLLDYSDNTLRLEVPFEFHKDRIESVGSREAINKMAANLFGNGFRVECVVNGNSKKKRQVSADIILQNIPPKEAPKKEAEKGEFKISKKVEAIFEGM